MNVTKAVAERILDICKEKNIAINTLATMAGMPPMTIYSMINGKNKAPTIVNIKKICDGFDISLKDFFDAPVFELLEQELQ